MVVVVGRQLRRRRRDLNWKGERTGQIGCRPYLVNFRGADLKRKALKVGSRAKASSHFPLLQADP